MAHLYRPLVPLHLWYPCHLGLPHRADVARFSSLIGKQGRDKPKRIDFDTQALQIHLFITQHFVYVFHSHQTQAGNGCNSFWLKCTACFSRLNSADCNP